MTPDFETQARQILTTLVGLRRELPNGGLYKYKIDDTVDALLSLHQAEIKRAEETAVMRGRYDAYFDITSMAGTGTQIRDYACARAAGYNKELTAIRGQEG